MQLTWKNPLLAGLVVSGAMGCGNGATSDVETGLGLETQALQDDAAPALSEPVAPQCKKTAGQPNILMILADDLGFSDIHALGAEIQTPNLDALVGDGRILTNHHSGTVSAIARAMLISGTDHHLVGEGTMGRPSDERRGLPGYEGYLNDRALSVAELLQDGGYHTYMAGKWHLGSGVCPPPGGVGGGKTPEQWGFEHSFAAVPGGIGNHFGHTRANSCDYVQDGQPVQPGQPGQPGGVGGVPAEFYTTDFFTDKLIEYIDSHQGDGQPFFAYAAYMSPHWPLQVPEPWLSMYSGQYDEGYDAVRAARIARIEELNLLPHLQDPAVPLPEALTRSPASPNDGTPEALYINADHGPNDGYVDYHRGAVNKRWESLTDLERKAQARYMEIYAGMVSNLDHNIGRLIQHLKDIGAYDNTFIMFQSDNGAEGWPIDSGADPRATDERNASPGVYETLGTDNGQPNARRLQYGIRWAEVSAAPLAQSKGYQGEGAIVTPAIVRLPGQSQGLPPSQHFTHITDATATFLELAGVAAPSEPAPPDIDPETGEDRNAGKVIYKDRYVYPITGQSLLHGSIPNASRPYPLGGESYGRAHIYSHCGAWKARWTEPPYGPAGGHWELFHIKTDLGEVDDVSAQHPEIAESLYQEWQEYMDRVGGVNPLRPVYYY